MQDIPQYGPRSGRGTLGEQYLMGIFPSHKTETQVNGPLRLVKCHGGKECWGLLQFWNIIMI
jgi:hypothetical protein